MIPVDFNYFSLVLTESSVNKLSDFISKNFTIQEVIKRKEVTGTFLHHCTLFHKNDKYPDTELMREDLYAFLKNEFETKIGEIYKLKIIGWGWNNRALALFVEKEDLDIYFTKRLPFNRVPHITVCTFDGAKPVESNNIKGLNLFSKPIEVNCILVENTLK